MKKRLFQVLDEMNVSDEQNKTQMVGLCPDFVRGNMSKMGYEIVMGVPKDVGHKILTDPKRYKPVLMVVDMDEYDKFSSE